MSGAQAAIILSVVLVAPSPSPAAILPAPNKLWLRVVRDQGHSDTFIVDGGNESVADDRR